LSKNQKNKIPKTKMNKVGESRT